MRVQLRPAVEADLPYARGLYFETMRWITERLFGWDEGREVAKFANQFVCAETSIVTLDGRDIGWVQFVEENDGFFLKQIYISPICQRQGLGSQVIQILIDRATKRGKPVRLGVVKFNPALELYKRLGFHVASKDSYKFYMERPSK